MIYNGVINWSYGGINQDTQISLGILNWSAARPIITARKTATISVIVTLNKNDIIRVCAENISSVATVIGEESFVMVEKI